jgi:hypothetical protein
VKQNALAGRRFASWKALNAWLEEWAVTVADQRAWHDPHCFRRRAAIRESAEA